MATITVKSGDNEESRVTALRTTFGLTKPVLIGVVPAGGSAEFIIEQGEHTDVFTYPPDWERRAAADKAQDEHIRKQDMASRNARLGIKEKG